MLQAYDSDSSDSSGSSDSSDSETLEQNTLNSLEVLLLNRNSISTLPPHSLSRFKDLRVLDLSSRGLTRLPQDLLQVCPLKRLILKNNNLTNGSLPKCFNSGKSSGLFELNLSGNLLQYFPEAVLELKNLKYLYLGANKIKSIPKDIWRLQRLKVLVLGGNFLTEIPDTVGDLHQLQALTLCDNQIEELPASIARLTHLEQLLIHKNNLRHLPPDIIALKNLNELSLRENPLIVRFVQEISIHPPTLLELSARVIRTSNIAFEPEDIPKTLRDYLNTAHYCVNPKCRGVFFDSRVEHIKFADFCGRYRIPLLQYLCSPRCIEPTKRANESGPSASSSDNDEMMRRVLLG